MAAASAALAGGAAGGDRNGGHSSPSPSSSSSSSCWFVLFLVQTAALVWKNVLMATRNWRATATQLAAPLLFVLVIFVVDVGVRASRARQPAFLDVRRSTPEAIRHIPDCEKDAFVMRNAEQCLDFAYAPAGNVHADALAANIAANNQPPIPQRRYRGFPDEASIDAYLLNHPNEVLGAVIFHFDDDDNNNSNNNNNNLRISSSSSEVEVVPVAIDYTLQTNSSVKFWRGEFRDPNTFAQLPLQVATEREIVRYLGNQARRSLGAVEDDQLDLTWNIALRTFPHPAAVAPSIVGGIAPGFLFAATMFSFVLVASNVVHERELQLRQGMESMGMLLSSYWTSWILWEGLMNVVSSGIITATGYLLGFSLFVKNSQALLFVVFFTFQNAMLAFALLISVFTKTSQGATSLSFGIFIIGWIFQSTVLFGFPYQPQYKSDVLRVIFNLLPWNPFTKAITDLGAATMTLPSDGDGFGITWRRRFAYCVPPSSSGIDTLPQSSSSHSMLVDSPTNANVGTGASAGHYTVGGCYLSVGDAIVWMSVMFFVFAFLAAYLDQIVPNSYGTRRPFYYFLMPNYWCARRSRVCQTSSSCCGGGGGGGGEEEGGGKDGEPTAAEAAGRNNNDKMMSNRTKAALRASLATPPLAQRVSSHNVDEDVEAEEQRARLHARILLAKAGERDGGGDGGDDSARADGSSLLEENVPQSSALPPSRFATIEEGEEELEQQQQQQQRAAIELFGLGKTYTLPPSSASGPQDPIEEEESAASTRNRLRRPTAMSRICGCLSRWFPLCASLRRKPKIKVAVGGTWLQLETGKVFALLGPNGAGKTTTIHMLTGLVVPTNGDANILGNSLVGAGGVDRVRQISGVCPQFDILWNQLTGIEHMRLFYALKGLWAQNLDHEHSSRALLERVKLDKVASRRTETYSGGMRRRLSVAIAMLGNPPVVYLDEPTTGMDPVSRRYVWDIIDEYKRNACVVLTTHSMEEADVLGDRVGIMSRGYLQVLGTSLHLKNRFGAGYRISVALEGSTTTMSKRKAELKRIVESTRSDDEMVAVPLLEEGATRYSMEGSRSMRGSDQKYGSYEHFVVPREEKRRLPDLFARLDECRVRLGIADVQVNLSPLEEVFLQVTTKEEES
ncbi:ABC transporter domain-containing protein [Pseudoscourfieldia marina]